MRNPPSSVGDSTMVDYDLRSNPPYMSTWQILFCRCDPLPLLLARFDNNRVWALAPRFLGFLRTARTMVYSKDVYIKIVVVVNVDTFLWISPDFELKSGVYELHKQAQKPCMTKELFWDKKTAPRKFFVYSHIVPVDIHRLIHRDKPPLK